MLGFKLIHISEGDPMAIIINACLPQTLFLPGVAAITLLCAFCQVTCWTISGERQLRKIRAQYLKSVLRQEMCWFDLQDEGTLSTRLSE